MYANEYYFTLLPFVPCIKPKNLAQNYHICTQVHMYKV
jgi:hypothetical protein